MYLPKEYRSISSPDLVKFKCHFLSGIKIKVNYGMTENKFLIKLLITQLGSRVVREESTHFRCFDLKIQSLNTHSN